MVGSLFFWGGLFCVCLFFVCFLTICSLDSEGPRCMSKTGSGFIQESKFLMKNEAGYS